MLVFFFSAARCLPRVYQGKAIGDSRRRGAGFIENPALNEKIKNLSRIRAKIRRPSLAGFRKSRDCALIVASVSKSVRNQGRGGTWAAFDAAALDSLKKRLRFESHTILRKIRSRGRVSSFFRRPCFGE